MKLFILTITILAVAQTTVTQNICDGLYIRNICYERLLLKGNLSMDYQQQLAMDLDKNILFFTQKLSETNELATAYLNLKTNESGLIDGIRWMGTAKIFDSKKHLLYLGGRGGIYSFDFDTKTAKYVTGENMKSMIYVSQMFYKDRLYYIDRVRSTAYYYENGETKKVEELKGTRVEAMAIDKKDNIVFLNDTGMFIFKRAEGKIAKVGDYSVYNQFIADNSRNIYFVSPNNILLYSVNDYNAVQILHVLQDFVIRGMVIDNDNNFIYVDSENIYKLTPSKKTYDKKKQNKETNNDNKEITTNNIVLNLVFPILPNKSYRIHIN